MDMEEFKDIKGYEGKYQVSNLGRVKSLWYQHGNIIKCCNGKLKSHKGFIWRYKNGWGLIVPSILKFNQ